MYTGIVKALGTITKQILQGTTLSYCVSCPNGFLDNVELGASISVDGICQTVKAVEGNVVWFDAIEETLKKTTLKSTKEQDIVHLERSAKIGDEIGGHMLSGHVMGTGRVRDVQSPSADTRILTIECAPQMMPYIFPKGFIAVDGASLTVVDVFEDAFSVHLIPETVKRTHFGKKTTNSLVNIEIDSTTQAIVTTVQRWMEHNHAETFS